MNPAPPRPSPSGLATAFFHSGWAFLAPYLAAYLIYAWLGCPVNPGSGRMIPCLLHVYYFIHTIHACLGAFALRSWWHTNGKSRGLATVLWGAAPWALLALIFWIPGAYLEYPSDPWEHLARINEWAHVAQVQDHYSWPKSSYLLAHSLLGDGVTPRSWGLGLYYTAACLLLCWQYFRLACTTGLSPRVSLVFVILQAVWLGNNLFTFYRYYGIASTLPAQITTIALIRTCIEAARQLLAHKTDRSRWRILGSAAAAGITLAIVTLFNHLQGLAIAALGLGAVACWTLVEWRRWTASLLAAVSLLTSVAFVLWWPKQPELDSFFVPEAWLTPWYGFNVFSPDSVSGERALQMLGTAGIVSLAAGLLLLRRNHVAAWLTLMPLVALCVPAFSLPFIDTLLREGGGNTITNVRTFNRLLLGIPVGLAVAVLLFRGLKPATPGPSARSRWTSLLPFAVCLSLLGAGTAASPGGTAFNRAWNALAVVPDDLELAHLSPPRIPRNPPSGDPMLMSPGTAFAWNALDLHRPGSRESNRRLEYYDIPVSQTVAIEARLLAVPPAAAAQAGLLVIPPARVFSVFSQAGYLSRHWTARHVALDMTGGPELANLASSRGWAEQTETAGTRFLTSPPVTPEKVHTRE